MREIEEERREEAMGKEEAERGNKVSETQNERDGLSERGIKRRQRNQGGLKKPFQTRRYLACHVDLNCFGMTSL